MKEPIEDRAHDICSNIVCGEAARLAQLLWELSRSESALPEETSELAQDIDNVIGTLKTLHRKATELRDFHKAWAEANRVLTNVRTRATVIENSIKTFAENELAATIE